MKKKLVKNNTYACMSLKNLNTWVRKNMGARANFVYIRAQTGVTFGRGV